MQIDRYQKIYEDFLPKTRDSSKQIKIEALDHLPDLTHIKTMGRTDSFSVFIPDHTKLAGELIELFMGKIFVLI